MEKRVNLTARDLGLKWCASGAGQFAMNHADISATVSASNSGAIFALIGIDFCAIGCSESVTSAKREVTREVVAQVTGRVRPKLRQEAFRLGRKKG